ncbi:MAG: beta-ketoacyl-ACP synthase II [Eubacterium sp.]|nr:beta-ketoacyl-ACP synthase II [Eubacterium sp.]
MQTKERVVITGLGAVTPLGTGMEKFWDNLISGKSGITNITKFDASGLPVQIAGEVTDFNPVGYMEKKQAREMEVFMQYGFAAADEAMKDAGLFMDGLGNYPVPKSRIGIVFGTVFGGIGATEEAAERLKDGSRVNPRVITKIIGNVGAAQIAIAKHLAGPSLTVSTACSSGLDAITVGNMLIESNMADIVICVGAEAATCPVTIEGLSAIHALSHRNDEPETASRPFDLDRDGFVMSEGSGAVIIEKLSVAKARGAKVHAELAGCSNGTDGFHVTSPHPDGIGAIATMEGALQAAGLEVKDIDYINAHGTSTPKGDVIEVKAIKTLFGEYAGKVAVSSTKASMGHLMGAGGVVETIACVKAVEEDIIPPTINQFTADPECDIDTVPNEARRTTVNVAMCNAFGFGGQNASVIVKKFAE